MYKDTNRTLVFSALEVAQICGIVNQTSINWIQKGYLTAYKTPGGQYRIYPDDLADFMTRRNMRIPEKLASLLSDDRAKRILVFHPNQGTNSVITKHLERSIDDCVIYQAFDSFTAGALAAVKKPHCIILDIQSFGTESTEPIIYLKNSANPTVPFVIAVTERKQTKLEERLKTAGADAFFVKPLNLEAITEIIRAALQTCNF